MAEQKRILILAYYSYMDPLFQSAVLPYFLNFPAKENFKFVLLTFEHDQYPLTQSERSAASRMLAGHQILWKRMKWRSGNFKLLKKAIDFVSAILYSFLLIKKHRLHAIYSEGFPGAILGYYGSLLSGVKHMVHTFEPHADYMVEAGVWGETSWETRVIRWHETRIARHATYIFTATKGLIEKLSTAGIPRERLFRVPSCVDMDHFQFSEGERIKVRKEMGIADHELVLVYLGKLGGMYMEDEAFQFFKTFQDQEQAWVLLITQEDERKISDGILRNGLNRSKTISVSLRREQIPSWLSASDVAFVAVRQRPSKKYCSPIKTGEYLACGLPVIVPRGISDDWQIIEELGIGAVLETSEKNAFLEVIKQWKRGIKGVDPNEIRRKTRAYADADRSIVRYKDLYRQLFEKL